MTERTGQAEQRCSVCSGLLVDYPTSLEESEEICPRCDWGICPAPRYDIPVQACSAAAPIPVNIMRVEMSEERPKEEKSKEEDWAFVVGRLLGAFVLFPALLALAYRVLVTVEAWLRGRGF